MFLPVNEKTVTASVFILVAAFAAGRILPPEFLRHDLAVWVFGLAVLYAIYNIVVGLLIMLIIGSGGFVARRFINPEVGREQHEMMNGHAVHETVYYKDGSEKHYFHYDPDLVEFTGGGN